MVKVETSCIINTPHLVLVIVGGEGGGRGRGRGTIHTYKKSSRGRQVQILRMGVVGKVIPSPPHILTLDVKKLNRLVGLVIFSSLWLIMMMFG